MAKRYSIDLGAHMAECDANYARLLALAPQLCAPRPAVGAINLALEDFSVEFGAGDVRVRIQLIESSRYTSLIQLTQHARGIADRFTPPTMAVRLYHDARSAEVVEVRNEARFKEVYKYPNPRMRARDEKAQVNRFLGEYLAICLRFGLADPIEVPVGSSRVNG